MNEWKQIYDGGSALKVKSAQTMGKTMKMRNDNKRHKKAAQSLPRFRKKHTQTTETTNTHRVFKLIINNSNEFLNYNHFEMTHKNPKPKKQLDAKKLRSPLTKIISCNGISN